MKKPSTHLKTLSLAETPHVLSEKALGGGNVAVATLTSYKAFAARNDGFMAGRGF